MTLDWHDWRSGRHVVYDLHAHIVLTPKYRRKVFTSRVTELIRDTFDEVCERQEVVIDAFETDQDHAHLLISYPPKVPLSKLVMTLKTMSSRRIRQKRWDEITSALWGDHFWSPSYAVVSAGGAPLEIVKQYVEDQDKPRRKYEKKPRRSQRP